MKKNLLTLTLLLSLVLPFAGCAKKEAPERESVQIVTASSSFKEPETAASSVDMTPLEAEVAEPAGPVNPLTGEETETDLSARRPFAVMLNSIKQSLPQSGNSKADMWFEMPEEGGITRVMGLYQNIDDVGTLGTCRSTRHYFLEMAIGMDAIVCHAGGASSAFDLLDWTGYKTLNALTNAGSMYYRNQERLAAGYATEHTMYTSSDNIKSYLEANPNFRTNHREHFEQTYEFADEATPAIDAIDANEVEVSFSGYKQTHFTFDPESGTYKVFFFGEPYVDEAAGNAQVETKNIIVIKAKQTTVQQDGPREWFDLVNGGSGYYISNGKCEPISWSKGEAIYPLQLKNTDGTPLQLNRGKTYFCVCNLDRAITMDGNNINGNGEAPAAEEPVTEPVENGEW